MKIEDIKAYYTGHKAKPTEKHRFFSVLVPFVTLDEKLHLIFEKRAEDMETQPGEICFPGGHMEKGEDPTECALREAYEEVGIPRDKIHVIGEGDKLFGYADFTLYTTIGEVDPSALKNLKLQEEEVGEVFTLPFDFFVENEPMVYTRRLYTEAPDFPYELVGIDRNYKWREGKWEVPIYVCQDRVVWGLTAKIIRNIVRSLKESGKDE